MSSVNIFRLVGDWLHVMAIVMVLNRLVVAKNAQGVSRKTQELYLLVFVTRYLDLFLEYYSLYNSVMKVYYILSTAFMVCLLTKSFGTLFSHPCNETYKPDQDNFPHWKYIVIPTFTLSSLIHFIGSGPTGFSLIELLWTFSICLEAAATIPQVIVFRTYRQVENLTGGSFLLLMGLYRGFYILSWIYRAHTEWNYQHHYLVYLAGVVQVTVALFGFFWPVSQEDSEGVASAPLLPQLKQFIHMYSSSTGTLAFVIATFVLFVGLPTMTAEQFMVFVGVAVMLFIGIATNGSCVPAETFEAGNDPSATEPGKVRKEEDAEFQVLTADNCKARPEPLDPLKAPLLEAYSQYSNEADIDLVADENQPQNAPEEDDSNTINHAEADPEAGTEA